MNNNHVAKSVQERVKRWMNYTWAQQNTFDENKVLEVLPLKMRTDIAMRVHFATLGISFIRQQIYDIYDTSNTLYDFTINLGTTEPM